MMKEKPIYNSNKEDKELMNKFNKKCTTLIRKYFKKFLKDPEVYLTK